MHFHVNSLAEPEYALTRVNSMRALENVFSCVNCMGELGDAISHIDIIQKQQAQFSFHFQNPEFLMEPVKFLV